MNRWRLIFNQALLKINEISSSEDQWGPELWPGCEVPAHFIPQPLIWWNWTSVTAWIELLWVPANRNPARPRLFVHRFGFIARLPGLTTGIIWPVRDGQFISGINIYNLLLSEFILGDGSILSTSQISWSYLCRLWNEFPPKNVSFFFFFFSVPTSSLSEINVCVCVL